jgi:hypothetical protein
VLGHFFYTTLNEFTIGNYDDFDDPGSIYFCPICIGQQASRLLFPRSDGSLHQISNPDKIINRGSKRKNPTDTVGASTPGFAQHADCFHPTEDFLDALRLSLTHRISSISRGALIDALDLLCVFCAT